VEDGRLLGLQAREGEWTAAPLWLVGAEVERRLRPLPGKPPHELGDVFQLAIDAGVRVSAIQVARTRDLTSPVDLVHENFPYLAGR
jgi:hypothetical protein